jgi:ribonuclease HI
MTEETRREITVTFSGKTQGNPGPGTWTAHQWEPATDKQRTLRGTAEGTTNTRMELMAALKGLLLVEAGSCLTMIGSDYVVRSMNEWLPLWQMNRWRKASGKRVENVDLWQALVEAVKKHRRVTWRTA